MAFLCRRRGDHRRPLWQTAHSFLANFLSDTTLKILFECSGGKTTVDQPSEFCPERPPG